jgi:catechol 2,3-dioxygenase-like lactoylglutathione lyase family enzyme
VSGKPMFNVFALTIACTHLERSQQFYDIVLGAERIPTDVGWWYRLGALKITLLPNATEPSPAAFPTHAMPILWLEVDNLPAAAERFAQYGVRVITPGDGQYMQVADPDGLVIEVWQAEPAVPGQAAYADSSAEPPDPDPMPLADRSTRVSLKDVLMGVGFLLALAAFALSVRNARKLEKLKLAKPPIEASERGQG